MTSFPLIERVRRLAEKANGTAGRFEARELCIDAPALADVAEQALKALIFIGSKRGCLFAECADAESIIAAVDKVLGMAEKE